MVRGSLNFFSTLFGLLEVFLAAMVGGFFGVILGLKFWIGVVVVAVFGLWLLVASWQMDRTERGLQELNPPQAAPSSPASPGGQTDELRKLAELRDSGALTEEEFASAKARVSSQQPE
jgi:hypothetical protein